MGHSFFRPLDFRFCAFLLGQAVWQDQVKNPSWTEIWLVEGGVKEKGTAGQGLFHCGCRRSEGEGYCRARVASLLLQEKP